MNNEDAALEDTNIFSAPGAPTESLVKTPPKKDACATAVNGDSHTQKKHTSLASDVYVSQKLRNLCEICKKKKKKKNVLKIISRNVVLNSSSSQFRNNHVVFDTI